MTGLEHFKTVLKEYRNLSVWAAGGSVVIPFVASFLSVIPPWPAGLNLITSILQLLALIFVYQNFVGRPRKSITRVVNRSILGVAITIILYLFVFSIFTIYIPENKSYITIGFKCTDDALKIQEYAAKCPFLDRDELKGALYVEYKLWTRSSISVVRVALVGLWFLFFGFLASAIGAFLVFQSRNTAPEKRA